ncbi:MAG: hypothetical protein ACXACO_21540, partial [Promethearchaeota archaeon]
MNRFIVRKLILLSCVLFFCGCVVLILNQNNFYKGRFKDKESNSTGIDFGLNISPPETGNVTASEKFQQFWTDVFQQDAINWSYIEWREYIILQIYGENEDSLNDTIKNDENFENNIHIFTIYAWGSYNGSLSIEDRISLKSKLIQNTVKIGDISFLKSDDAQLKLFVNIEVKSSQSMWYTADRLRIYLKSEDSLGKWYNESGTHFIKVFDEVNLDLTDSSYLDGNFEIHIVGPIIIDTNVVEESVSLIARVDYFMNVLMNFDIEKVKSFNINDDDTAAPVITYIYTGDYTDG